MPPRPDDAWQIVVVVQRPRVDRRSRVTQQQSPDASFGLGLRDRPGQVGVSSAVLDADMTVRVDEPGQYPPAVVDEVGIGDGLRRQDAAVDPQVDRGLVRQPASPHPQCRHRRPAYFFGSFSCERSIPSSPGGN